MTDLSSSPARVVLEGDALERLKGLPSASIDCIVTSPPYWSLRNYGVDGQIGLEPTWQEHIQRLLPVFAECKRVLKPTGSMWVNYGDVVLTGGRSKNPGGQTAIRTAEAIQPPEAPNRTMKGPKKHKLGLHWRLRFALNDELGWISRADVVWWKRNAMNLSMKDRVTPKYEHFFHFVQGQRYFFDLDAIRAPYAGNETWTERRSRMNAAETDATGTWFKTAYHRPRTDNTWDARRGSDVDGKGPPPGQKPQSRQRANRGWSAVATSDRGRPPGQERGGKLPSPHARLLPDQERFHALGANPGDVWAIPEDVWDIPAAPFDGAHFAVFPMELARRAIVSSCPREVCTACGAPRRLVSDVEYEDARGSGKSKQERVEEVAATGSHRPAGNGFRFGTGRAKRTPIGYSDCGCGAPFRAGIVLDPFAGAFTTCVVAAKEKRGFVGIELKPEYVKMGRDRLAPFIGMGRPAQGEKALQAFGGDA